MFEEKIMHRAIEISAQALNTPGTEPFGAVVVKSGRIVGEGLNRSLLNHDPTSHGEIEAIRDACRKLNTVDLRGSVLYSSCEPCALCVAAIEIVGIDRLYYAADVAQSGMALRDLPETARFPIDSEKLQSECGKPVSERTMPTQQALGAEATNFISAWAKKVRGR